MTISGMAYLADRLDALGIPFSWMRWEGDTATESTYYFVGETSENATETRQESGRQESQVILRGFTRGTYLLLLKAKETIEAGLPTQTKLTDGTGIAICYDDGNLVSTGNAELKSIKIDLTVQEWKER